MSDWIELVEDAGVKKRILREGNEQVPANSIVTVHYTGRLAANGEKFDSSLDKGQPFQFTLGENQVIKAWEVGVSSMKVGEKCELHCEPSYAYGEAGAPPTIPSNAVLLFEVELLDFEENPKDPDEIVAFCQRMKESGNGFMKESGLKQKALKCYEKALEKMKGCPKFPEELKIALLVNASIAASSLDEHKKSIEYSKKALNLNPQHSKAAYRLAFALCSVGDLSEAIGICRQFESNLVEFATLKSQIEQKQKQQEHREREMCSRMFK